MRPDKSGESCKTTRTLCLDVFEFIEIVNMAVDQWFIGQGPHMLGRMQLGETREAGRTDEVRAGTVSVLLSRIGLGVTGTWHTHGSTQAPEVLPSSLGVHLTASVFLDRQEETATPPTSAASVQGTRSLRLNRSSFLHDSSIQQEMVSITLCLPA